jgi:membrane-associated protease RseP (regulator of RpoE activity)
LGSKELVDVIKKQTSNVAAMINMDMIGRLNAAKDLQVGGTGTCPEFSKIVDRNKPAGFHVTMDESGTGPTDHTSFYLKDIPVLNFFTGTHTDYHKPSDDEDKINYYGIKNILEYVFRCTNEIANLDAVVFTKTKANAEKIRPKYKVTMGVMPDYSEHPDGMHIDGVTDNRPAQKAGLQEGDVITKIGATNVKDVYSYMEALGKINPGDEVDVTYSRNGTSQTVKVKFE